MNHNRIKVADLEKNQSNKILATNNDGVLEFKDIGDISYNDLDYTSQGKVLDARQGKALKEYVDTKVADAITDGKTDVAPSQNAVYDALNSKVDKVSGKVLSTEDYTTAEKTMVATIGNKVDKTATHYIGTTAIINNRTSAPQTLTGVSIDGNAGTATNVAWSGITSKPTTLSGYGITDAASNTHNHTVDSLSNVTVTSKAANDILQWNGTTWVNKTIAGAGLQPAGSYLTANQSISVSGDATGSGNTAINLTLANSGVTAGTYPKVTVDAKGRVTAGTALATSDVPSLDWSKITSGKPTTLLGYGITDAASNTHNHTVDSLSNVTVTSKAANDILQWNGTTWVNKTIAGAGLQPAGSYLTANQSISVSGDVTGSGNTAINLTLANSGVTAGTYPKVTVDAKGRVTEGAALAASDVPSLDWSKITSGKPTTLSGYGITDGVKTDGSGATGTWTINVSGNAATATKLQTTRTINGISFDGTANINVFDNTKLPLTGGSLSGQLYQNGGNVVLDSGNWSSYISGNTWYDGWVGYPGYDADTITPSKSGFTYQNNAPWNGPLARFDAGGYDLEFNAEYQDSGYGSNISFRTFNGDGGYWNNWQTFIHDGNIQNYSVGYANNAGNAYYASNVSWYGIYSKPTTLSGFGITNAVPQQDGTRSNLNLNAVLTSGFYNVDGSPVNAPSGFVFGQIIAAKGIDTGLQIAGGHNMDNLWFRGWTSSGSTFSSWRKVWHDGNLTNPTTGTGAVNYIPKWASSSVLTNSMISDNGSIITIGGGLTVNGTTTINGTLTATRLKYTSVENYSNLDLNNLYIGGHYSGSTMTNAPDYGWWWIEVVVESSDYFFQRATSQGIGGTYPKGTILQRTYSGGWTNWQKIILEDVSTGLVDTITSKTIYNRGSWNAPTKGIITQVTDNSGSQHSVIVGLKSNGTTRSYGIDFLDSDASPEMRLYGGTGYVAINSTSTTVSGALNAMGDVVAYSSSDKHLKDNVEPIENALEKVSKLSGYEFDWNNKQDTYNGHDIGVIAQEVEEVFPELVTTRDNGYKAVKYEKLVAVLISGINELQEEVKQLKEQVNAFTK